MKKKIIINILLLVLIVIFVYATYNVAIWLKSDKEIKALESGLYSNVVSIVDSEDFDATTNNVVQDEPKIVIDFATLKETNPDVIAWIRINDTYINYPILQGKTDQYYLRKDIYGKYSISGSIFVYSDVDREFNDENTVIYGHNMKNDRMFADIQKIYNGDLGNDVEVEIYTENATKRYKVFSCYIEKPSLSILKNTFTSREKIDYIDSAIQKSEISFNADINYANKIITLVTCGDTNAERMVVNAIEIK